MPITCDQFITFIQNHQKVFEEPFTWRGTWVKHDVKKLEKSIKNNRALFCVRQLVIGGKRYLRALQTFCTKHGLAIDRIERADRLFWENETINNDRQDKFIIVFKSK